MPGAKNGERPYLAVPKPGFWDPFFGAFSPISVATLPNVTHLFYYPATLILIYLPH